MPAVKPPRPAVIRSQRGINSAVRRLAREEKVFARLVDEYGIVRPWWREPGFATLAYIVCEQLISLEAARTIWRRVEDQTGGVSPASIAALNVDGVRAAGLTMAKARTIVNLARGTLDGSLDLDALESAPDNQALNTLTSIRGIGPWTAEVYLLGALRRADLFPVADRALVIAAGEFGLTRGEVKARALARRAEAFAPNRSAAAWQLWHCYLKKRDRQDPV